MRRFFIGSKSGEQDKSNKSDNIHLSKDLRNKINLFYLLTWNNEEVNIDDDSSVDIDTVTPKPDASTQTEWIYRRWLEVWFIKTNHLFKRKQASQTCF